MYFARAFDISGRPLLGSDGGVFIHYKSMYYVREYVRAFHWHRATVLVAIAPTTDEGKYSELLPCEFIQLVHIDEVKALKSRLISEGIKM